MNRLLEGKKVIVTGGSRGIGRSIVLACARHGADVVFTYAASVQAAEATAQEARSYGTQVIPLQNNAAVYSDAEKLIEFTLEKLGGIDVLINNAGITRDGLLMRMTEENWNEVLHNNLTICFYTVKAVQRHFLKQRNGVIINMSSVVGESGNAGQANYAASKAGLNGFTKSVAKELGSRNIRCNAIAPGFIETEMTAKLDENTRKSWTDSIPLRRAGTPEDVANLAVFLASDMAAYITGQVINVCGGMQM
jgi:3-oxoacyl-[acyl-carrier protein] reductase